MGRNGVLDSNVILLVSFSLLLPCAAHSCLAPKDTALPPLDTTADAIDLRAGIALTKSPVGQTENLCPTTGELGRQNQRSQACQTSRAGAEPKFQAQDT